MDQDTDDDFMDTSPEPYGDSDCVNPPVTNKYTDDAMDNNHVTNQDNVLAPSPATHQDPDIVVGKPPVKHDEKHTENLNKDNYHPAETDSTTTAEFKMQLTFTKEVGEYKVNVVQE